MTQPYRPPVDVDFGAPLPERTPTPGTDELHAIHLAGYSLVAGVHHGKPFVRAPGATTAWVLATLQSIVAALQADDAPADSSDAIPCGRCGRDHIPDEGDPTQADTCWECQNGYGDDQ